MRSAAVERKTLETGVSVEWNLDGSGSCEINTGIGFLDHMLTLLAKHSFSDLTVQAKGDLDVDSHHTVEDCGIVLGQALKEAIGDKAGIHRYGNCFLPMDEALVQVCLDFSGRSYLVFDADIPKVQLGIYACFRARTRIILSRRCSRALRERWQRRGVLIREFVGL